MTFGRLSALAAALGLVVTASPSTAQTLYGPQPYLSRADSPFQDCVFLETFEDHLFNSLGVSASAGFVTSTQFSTNIDSVDADDGNIDGSGSQSDSFFSSSGFMGITFTFDSMALGGFPTRAGIVWTDGAGMTRFEAFDPLGASLGVIGPVSIAGAGTNGSTAEDRFFGVESVSGIGSIKVSNSLGGIEVDHLQYALTTGTAIKATESVRLGFPANPDALRKSLSTPPSLGSLWTPWVDHSSFAVSAAVDVLFLDATPQINVPLAFGTLLCSLPPGNQIFTVSAGTPFAIKVPEKCAFAGLALCTQAASFTGSVVELTNALDIVLGTF